MALGVDGAAFLDDAEQEIPRAAVAQLSHVPVDVLGQIVQSAAAALVRDRLVNPSKALAEAADEATCVSTLARLPGVDERAAKSIYMAVCVLVTTSARDNHKSLAAQRQALLDYGFEDTDFVNELASLIYGATPSVKLVLERTSFDFAHVVDVTWRLDYALRSSSAGSIHEALYFVELKLQQPSGVLDTLRFSCSVEELRDLVYRIQEAANQLDRLASGATTS